MYFLFFTNRRAKRNPIEIPRACLRSLKTNSDKICRCWVDAKLTHLRASDKETTELEL